MFFHFLFSESRDSEIKIGLLYQLEALISFFTLGLGRAIRPSSNPSSQAEVLELVPFSVEG